MDAPVRLKFHTGNPFAPEHERWEDYWLGETFTMAPGLEPYVVAPPPRPRARGKHFDHQVRRALHAALAHHAQAVA